MVTFVDNFVLPPASALLRPLTAVDVDDVHDQWHRAGDGGEALDQFSVPELVIVQVRPAAIAQRFGLLLALGYLFGG